MPQERIRDRGQWKDVEDPTVSFSIEFFPPKTEKGEALLRKRMPTFLRLSEPPNRRPRFIDITWGAGGSTSHKTLDWVREWSQQYPDIPVNMHITCTNMQTDEIEQALTEVYELGIRNLVALRGDPPAPKPEVAELRVVEPRVMERIETDRVFQYGIDLVRHLRANERGAEWHITVGGYPEGHPERIETISGEVSGLSESEKLRASVCSGGPEGTISVCRDTVWESELQHLARKVHAGADLVISQLFFEPQIFLQFLSGARRIGIDCPIVPGIMLIQDYAGFHRMIGFCKTKVPAWILDGLEKVRDDPEAVRVFGSEVASAIIRELYDAGVRHFHFYALNRTEVLERVLTRLFDLESFILPKTI